MSAQVIAMPPPNKFALSPLDLKRWLEQVTLSDASRSGCRIAAVLTMHLNSTSGRCDPSYTRIAKITGIAPPNISRGLKELRLAGFVLEVSGQHRSKSYALKLKDFQPLEVVSRDNRLLSGEITPGLSAEIIKRDKRTCEGTSKGDRPVSPSDAPTSSRTARASKKELFARGRKLLGKASGGLVAKLESEIGLQDAMAVLARSAEIEAVDTRREYVGAAMKKGGERTRLESLFAELVEVTKSVAPNEAPGDAFRYFERVCKAGDKAEEVAANIIAGAKRAVADGWPNERGRPVDLKWWLNGERWKASQPAADGKARVMDFGDDPNAY